MKKLCLYGLVLLGMSAAGQNKIVWAREEQKAIFILNRLLLNVQAIDKPGVDGIFGNLSWKPVFPANYELHIGSSSSLIDFAIETERSSITTASVTYQSGKVWFSFLIDNLAERRTQPPSFELLQKSLASEIQQLDYKPGYPKFLQLLTTINF